LTAAENGRDDALKTPSSGVFASDRSATYPRATPPARPSAAPLLEERFERSLILDGGLAERSF